METYTPSQARANFFKIMDHTIQSHDPVYIIGKNKKNAVLISEEDYRALMETLYLTSIPGMKESILAAHAEPVETFVEEIDWDNV